MTMGVAYNQKDVGPVLTRDRVSDSTGIGSIATQSLEKLRQLGVKQGAILLESDLPLVEINTNQQPEDVIEKIQKAYQTRSRRH